MVALFSDVDLRDNSIYVLPSSAAASGGDEPFPAPPSSESIYRDDGWTDSPPLYALILNEFRDLHS